MNEKEFNFIYKITRNFDDKFYIGMHSTNNLDDGYLGGGTRIGRSLKAHGKENHKREILEFANDRSSLEILESIYVDKNLLMNPNCLNLALGGRGGVMVSIPPETRAKMSHSHKNLSEEKRNNISNGSRNRPKICYEKMVETKRSEGTLARSEETRKKMSNSHLGKNKSESHIKNMSLAKQNRTDEYKKEIRHKASVGSSKITWVIEFENSDKIFKTKNLKGWCASLDNFNITGIMRTFVNKRFYKGARVVEKLFD